MPFHHQTFQSSQYPTFLPFHPLSLQPFHPLTFQPLTSKVSNTGKNVSKNWPGGQNFLLMVEGLRKNCGRYKNSQTKYTPLKKCSRGEKHFNNAAKVIRAHRFSAYFIVKMSSLPTGNLRRNLAGLVPRSSAAGP